MAEVAPASTLPDIVGPDGLTELRGRRRHKWGPIPGREPEAPNGADARKRKRKSRWGDKEEANNEKAIVLMPSEIVLSNGIKVLLPASVTGRSPTGDPEVVELHKELNALNRLLLDGLVDIPPEGDRSPSPPPVYDSMGVRLNTREVRYREKMQRQRNSLIERLIAKDPTYRPPSDYRPEKKWVKLRIPQREYPGYNFIGLIIGPRGQTQQRMQAETNTKIAIRGRGASKEGSLRAQQQPGDDEELHVMITGDRQEDVDAAKVLVERLLRPLDEEMNEHKKMQLRELAAMNGTLKDTLYCTNCAEPGHTAVNCPKAALDVYRLPDQIANRVEEQYARDVARMNPGAEGASMEQEFSSFLAELGGTDPRAGTGAGAAPSRPGLGAPRTRPGDELPDSCKVYVGNLGPMASEEAVRPVFEPFGRVVHCAVPRDHATGFARGFAFVTFADDSAATSARQALDGTMVEDRPILVRMKGEPRDVGGRPGPPMPFGGPPGRRGPPPPRPDDELPPECKLYVGGLPPSADDALLHQEFARFGHIVSVRIIVDRDTGRPRGYGFVNFADPEAARAAQQAMSGYTGLEGGRPLIVRSSGLERGPPRPPFRGPPPFGGGGYYGGPPAPPYGAGGPPPPYGGPPPPYGGAPPQQGGAYGAQYPPPSSGAYGAVPPPPGAYPGGAAYPPAEGADPYAAYAGADPYGYAAYGAVPPPPPEQQQPQAVAAAPYGMAYDANGAPIAAGEEAPPPPPPPPPVAAGDDVPPPPPPPAVAAQEAAPVESEYERFMAEMSAQYK